MLSSVFKGRDTSGGTPWNTCRGDPDVVPQLCKCYGTYEVYFHMLKLLMQWLLVLKYHYVINIWMLRTKLSNLYHCFTITMGFFLTENATQKKYRENVDLFNVDLLVGMFQAFRFHQKLIQHKLLLILTFKSWLSVLWIGK